MRTVEGVRGNVREDDELAAALERHEAAGTLERVEIPAADRVKSRLRVTTDAGTELGVVVGGEPLRDGDVLVREDDLLVVVAFADREALAVDLPAAASPATLVELGHRIGNQHWDLAVEGGTVYVPLDADRSIVEDVLADALPATAEARVETVDGGLFVDGDGGGRGSHDDGHGHGGGHHHHDGDHSHVHDEHSHVDDGHDHAHEQHGHEHQNHEHPHAHGDHDRDHDDESASGRQGGAQRGDRA